MGRSHDQSAHSSLGRRRCHVRKPANSSPIAAAIRSMPKRPFDLRISDVGGHRITGRKPVPACKNQRGRLIVSAAPAHFPHSQHPIKRPPRLRSNRLSRLSRTCPTLKIGTLPEPSYNCADEHSGYDHGEHNRVVASFRSPSRRKFARLRTGNPARNSPSFPRKGACCSSRSQQSKTYEARPAQQSPTTAIARIATDVRDRHLVLNRIAHRLPIGVHPGLTG